MVKVHCLLIKLSVKNGIQFGKEFESKKVGISSHPNLRFEHLDTDLSENLFYLAFFRIKRMQWFHFTEIQINKGCRCLL